MGLVRRLGLITIATSSLVACADGGETASPETVVRAAEATIESGSAAFDQSVTFEGSTQVPEATELGAIGTSSFLGYPKAVSATADFGPGVGTAEWIVDGTDAYLRGDLVAEVTGDPETWLLVDLESGDPAAVQFRALVTGQNDASLLLYYLFGVAGDVEVIGNETVGGVDCTHYRMSVRLGLAVENSPYDGREALRLNLVEVMRQDSSTILDAEVWIDRAGLVRRTIYVYDLGDPAGGGTARVVTDLSEFGEHSAVEAPSGTIVSLDDLTV